MFASNTRLTLPVPNDIGQTVTIQKLSGKQLEKAEAAHLRTTLADPRGWATRFQQLVKAGKEAVINDPLLGYDYDEIIAGGLVGWTYKVNNEPKTVDAAAIADLEDEPRRWLATEIMRLTKPALFLTVEEIEASRKNA